MATSTRRKQPADRELKKERLDLAYEGARRILDEHERMVLLGADQDAFLDAIMDPPEPTGELLAALRRHREVLG